MRLFWSGSSRVHDWSAEGRVMARRMVDGLRAAELIGEVEWYAAAPDDERRDVASDDGVLDRLLAAPAPRRRIYRFQAGGSRPQSWELGMQLPAWDAAEGAAEAINTLKLWFDDDRFRGPAGSEALVRAFRTIHGAGDTEAAYVHPFASWLELTDALDGAYAQPLTLGPMFHGVMWINFLGGRHLEFFDVPALRRLDAYRVEWMGDDGLFLRGCDDVRAAATPAVVAELIQLTGALRRALRRRR